MRISNLKCDEPFHIQYAETQKSIAGKVIGEGYTT